MPIAILPDISEQHCIGCALCVEICTSLGPDVLRVKTVEGWKRGKAFVFYPERCISDGACIGVCPTKAIFWMRPMDYTAGQPIPLKKQRLFVKGWEEDEDFATPSASHDQETSEGTTKDKPLLTELPATSDHQEGKASPILWSEPDIKPKDIFQSSELEIDQASEKIENENKREEGIIKYPETRFPEEVILEQEVPLVIVIKSEKPQKQENPDRIKFRPSPGKKEVTVRITLRLGEAFDVTDNRYSDVIEVPLDSRDSPPVIFYLKGTLEGTFNIYIEFEQENNYVGQVSKRVKVLSTKRSENTSVLKPMPKPEGLSWSTNGDYPQPPDLKLYVMKGKGSEYRYMLLKNNGKYEGRYNHNLYKKDIMNVLTGIIKDIESNVNTPTGIELRMRNRGRIFYQKVFPELMKKDYWDMRKENGDKLCRLSIQVFCEEPCVPWEIVKPLEESIINEAGKPLEEDFLCKEYSLSRWFWGRRFMYREKKQILSIKMLIPYDNGLPSTQEEASWIKNFGEGISCKVDRISRFVDLKRVLEEGNFDLLHISSHGDFNNTDPLSSTIRLSDQDIRPLDIKFMNFGSSNPLVVINTCKSARQGFSFGVIEGWANAFLEAGASAVIGTIWSVTDGTALNFTRALYHELSLGNTLGEAVRQARIKCYKLGDVSSLAYVLYGHPNTRTQFGKRCELQRYQ